MFRKSFLLLLISVALSLLPSLGEAGGGGLDRGFVPDLSSLGPASRVYEVVAQTDGKLLVSSFNGRVSKIVRLNADGSRDETFRNIVVDTLADNVGVSTLALQSDGKLLIGGSFEVVNGERLRQSGRNIARLTENGELDQTFTAAPDGPVGAMVVLPSGNILIGGLFWGSKLQRLGRDGGGAVSFGSVQKLNGTVTALAIQPNGRILVGGDFTKVGGEDRRNIVRLMPDGSLDRSFVAQTNGLVRYFALAPSGKIVLSGFPGLGVRCLNDDGREYSVITDAYALAVVQPDNKLLLARDSSVERLSSATDPRVDPTFTNGADGPVDGLLVQSDGKVLLWGRFSNVNGQPRRFIARLNANDAFDPTFKSNANGSIQALAIQVDGKMLLGGEFSQVNGEQHGRVARLMADGTLDSGFTARTDNTLSALAIQSDGKVLLGGAFNQVNGTSRARLARLKPDGSVDDGFNLSDPDTPPFSFGADKRVTALALKDNKILMAGNFSDGVLPLNSDGRIDRGSTGPDGSPIRPVVDFPIDLAAGQTVNALALLPHDDQPLVLAGGLFIQGLGDTVDFKNYVAANPIDFVRTLSPAADGEVHAIITLRDNGVLLGGKFSQVGSSSRKRIARLTNSGDVDSNFAPTVEGVAVYAIAIQPGGKVLLGGEFSRVNGEPHNNIVRLNTDGSLDPSFTAQTNGPVYAISLQPDGRAIVGGDFTTVNDEPRERLVRLPAPIQSSAARSH